MAVELFFLVKPFHHVNWCWKFVTFFLRLFLNGAGIHFLLGHGYRDFLVSMVFWDIGALLATVPMLVLAVPVAGLWRALKIIIKSVLVHIICYIVLVSSLLHQLLMVFLKKYK